MSAAVGAEPDVGPAPKRPKRTYRACYPCRSVSPLSLGPFLAVGRWSADHPGSIPRSAPIRLLHHPAPPPTPANTQRKLKCNFGDPDKPWDGPCVRCTRERRECVRAMSTVVRYALPDVPVTHVPAPAAASTSPYSSSRSHAGHSSRAPLPSSERDRSNPRNAHPRSPGRADEPVLPGPVDYDQRYEEEVEGDERQSPALEDDSEGSREGGQALLMSNLQNPNDALRLLASASSLRYTTGLAGEGAASPPRGGLSPWHWWSPVEEGWVTEMEAGALLVL